MVRGDKGLKVFIDTEFTGLKQDARLISLALLTENGQVFYAEFTDYPGSVDPWIEENVIKGLFLEAPAPGKPGRAEERENMLLIKGDTSYILPFLHDWISQFNDVEIWGDCLSYDWVLFCELFRGALDIPSNIWYIPYDICTLMEAKDIDSDTNREEILESIEDDEIMDFSWLKKHNALFDAYLIYLWWRYLTEAV